MITPDRDSVERLILDDGREICADLFVDASGFRSLLIEKALGSPFIELRVDAVLRYRLVGELPQTGTIQPYTTAETMDAGLVLAHPGRRGETIAGTCTRRRT